MAVAALPQWSDPRLAEALSQFEQGRYAEARASAVDATAAASVVAEDGSAAAIRQPEIWWQRALDDLSTAHEAAGGEEHAQVLYLRMLAWREGTDQFRQGNFGACKCLFSQSPEYKSAEDVSWLLQSLKPEDAHSVPRVVGILALGEENAAKAAVALWTLALRPQHRPLITECGGTELLAKAVAHYSDNAELQAAACGALRLLCMGHRLAKRNRQLLVSSLGGPQLLTTALRSHPTDPEVQREACGALRLLAAKEPQGAVRILDHGGLRLCLVALAECPEDEAVAEAACRTLEALRGSQEPRRSGEGEAQARVAEDRAAGLRFCNGHLKEMLSGAHTAMGSHIPFTSILRAAAILLEHDEGMRHTALGLIKRAAACMQAFPGHTKLQTAAASVLHVLTCGAGHIALEEAGAKLSKSMAFVPLCQAMRDLPCQGDLQRLCCGVLFNVAKFSNEHKTSGVKAGAIPAIVTAMRRFSKDAVLQEWATGALLSLCDTVGRSASCAKIGGIECVIAAVRRFGASGRVAELGCLVLLMFCDDDKLRAHVLAAGAVPVAKSLQLAGTTTPETQRWARELESELTGGASASADRLAP